jgi:hypothetical protein
LKVGDSGSEIFYADIKEKKVEIGGFTVTKLADWNASSIYSYDSSRISSDAISKNLKVNFVNDTSNTPATSVLISSLGIRTAVS